MPLGVTQDDGAFLELPATRAQGGRKQHRTIKCPDKLVGQAKVWRLEQRGIQSSPEVGKVVGNCVEVLRGLLIAGRGQRQEMGPELASVRSRDLLGELARRLPASTESYDRVDLSARVVGALCSIPPRRARHHHKTYMRSAMSTSTIAVRTAPVRRARAIANWPSGSRRCSRGQVESFNPSGDAQIAHRWLRRGQTLAHRALH